MHTGTITIRGVEYSSITEATKAHGINNRTYHTRIKRGWSPEQALQLVAPPKKYFSAYNHWLALQDEPVRICNACAEEKPLEDFYKKSSKIGYGARCRPCVSKQVLRNLRKRVYGLDPDQWKALFESQDRCCAICKTKHPGKGTWHTDHCHSTNTVRGILCRNCNVGLGFFKDKTELLQAAIGYLDE